MLVRLLLSLLVTAGLCGVVGFGLLSLNDYAQLIKAYAAFENAVRSNADLRALYIAGTSQDVYRINVSADGIWALLCAILSASGLHGLLTHATRAPKGDAQ